MGTISTTQEDIRARILIGLLTCHAHRDRDEMPLRTWIPIARELGMRVVLILGDGKFCREPFLDGDYLHTPAQDTYPTLTQKTAWLCRWALTQPDWTTLFKADQDTYLVPHRLAAYPFEGLDYVGCEPGGRYRGWCSGGAGYGLSRRAAELVANGMHEKVGAEDVCVSRVLRKNRIRGHYDERFIPWGAETRRPTAANQVVTCHKIPAELWMRIHREMYPASNAQGLRPQELAE